MSLFLQIWWTGAIVFFLTNTASHSFARSEFYELVTFRMNWYGVFTYLFWTILLTIGWPLSLVLLLWNGLDHEHESRQLIKEKFRAFDIFQREDEP